jgi:uncharacterized protein (DUF2336 family)
VSGASHKKSTLAAALSYEESKRLARDNDPAIRAELAARQDVRPEVLYYLAEDSSAEVRCRIAGNLKTPCQADLILARDKNEAVRCRLASKIAELLPELDEKAQAEAREYVLDVIEILAQDQATRVRQIIAETLKDVASAPPQVIRRLARDMAEAVSCPVLEFSPLLTDQDLLDIIEEGCASGKLTAISRRSGVGEQVTDAIVAVKDSAAITALLENKSAQIREETLDGLVNASLEVTAWHKPLVERPALSLKAIKKLASFVASVLLDLLESREDLDKKTSRAVAKEVKRRLDKEEKEKKRAKKKSRKNCTPAESAEARARRMIESGNLDDKALLRALNSGDRDLVRNALALRAKLPLSLIDHILTAHSAKGVTALAWRAGCSMRFAKQLQIRMGGIPPSQVLNPRAGTDYPLSPGDMDWQIEFFQSLSG